MSTAIVPARNQQLIRHDRRSMFSDDVALRKQIQATHAYDERSIDTEYILSIVKDIFNLVSPGIDGIINVSIFESLCLTLLLHLFWSALTSSCSWSGLDESRRNPRRNSRADRLWWHPRHISLSSEQDFLWGWSLISILINCTMFHFNPDIWPDWLTELDPFDDLTQLFLY